jgi:septum formation protein
MSLKKTMIYLASQSPRRKEILRKLGIPFRVAESSYREKKIPGAPPEELVLKHALGKAVQARVLNKKRWVLGADTIVYCERKILGKPKSMKDAFRMIQMLSGKSHEVYTGIVLLQASSGKIYSGLAVTKVFFKKLKAENIHEYFQTMNPLDKAGAYAIQEGMVIVKKIEGSYTNVVGLPAELLTLMLKNI